MAGNNIDNPNGPQDKPIANTGTTILGQGEGEPGFTRSGPILDVDTFRLQYLFGIPLRAPLTGQEVTDDMLKMFIRKGISDFETSVRIPVSPVRKTDKINYERADDTQFGTRQLERWPVLKIEALQALYPGRHLGQEANYPTDWVVPQGDTGLIRIVPRSGTDVNANINFVTSVGYTGIQMNNFKHWPDLWSITYIAGFDFEKIPDVVNDLIGTLAAIKLLSQLGPALMPFNSRSIGLDGMSQGTSNGGPAWLAGRIADLIAERDRLVANLKSHYGTDIVMMAW